MLGALAVALYAQASFAQVAPPNGLPDRGVLRLQLGSTVTSGGLHTPKRFVQEPSGLTQAINKSGNCGLALGGPTALATISALGGNNSVGLGTTSIGVYNGSSGTACYTITASLGESIRVGLGAGMASPQIDANAFYRLVLDVEVKKNAEFLLQVLAGDAVADEFRMRTGSSIVAGEGSGSPGSPDKIFNCSAKSDSGPDSGINDNCRWDVSALGTSFRLIALQGEGSLEGGGDWGSNAYANNSLVYLTKGVIGAIGCETSTVPQDTQTATIGDGVNTAQCGVTRIDPTGLGGTCTTAIGYVFRSIDGADEGCEINKTPSEQLAASVDISFPPEPATPLGSEPLTRIQFSTNVPGQYVDFTPQRCIGTVVNDHNGEPTILEVLSNPGFVADVVPATSQKDWACVLNSATEYLGSGQMRIKQTILFWGDINFTRQ
jgi:hypothetical protein